MAETKYSFCRICEVACGLELTVEDNRITNVIPDKNHVVTKGFACRKGLTFHTFLYSPDRVLQPKKRTGDKWAEISWEQAIDEIGAKIRQLIKEHGPDSIAINMGSATAFNFAGSTAMNGILEGLKLKNAYGTGSVDCNNKFVVHQHMYGSPFLVPFPDLKHTRMFIGIGANPAISQMTFSQSPNAIKQIRDIEKRGGRVVFVNPRYTESAKYTGEQVFIRPDTDIFFLLAFLNELIRIGGVDQERVAKYMTGFDELKQLCEPWTPERAEEVTMIPGDKICELVKAHAEADGAVLYCATGINQSSNGTLSFWILEAINAVSGNLDRRGGTIVGKGLYDMPKSLKKSGKLERIDRTRVNDMPSVLDTFPSGILTNEILTPGEGQIKALINIGGNPAITYANPNKHMEKAFEKLELMVCLDLFRNETANYAHYILPCTGFFERPDIPMVLHLMAGVQPERYVMYTDQVVTPPEGVREESWIFIKLAKAAGIRLFGIPGLTPFLNFLLKRGKLTPDSFNSMGLKFASGVASMEEQKKDYPHGQMLDPNLPETFLGKRELTKSKKVDLAPKLFMNAAKELEAVYQREMDNKDRFKLISKREPFTHNSWTHNSYSFVGPDRTMNFLYLNPDDAGKLNLKEGDTAEISSSHGTVTIPVRFSEDLMSGVVAFPHGWGHKDADGLSIASKHAGINANYITPDGPEGCEQLSGMSHMTGFVVDVKKV